MSEEFMNACGLSTDVVPDFQLCFSTSIRPSCLSSRVLKSLEVLIGDVSMPVDMLVLPMLDFDVVLGMNWLNQYCVVIDCFQASLSFEVGSATVTHELTRLRPTHMPI